MKNTILLAGLAAVVNTAYAAGAGGAGGQGTVTTEPWSTSNIRYKATDRYRLVPPAKEYNMMNRLERRQMALNHRWLNRLKWYGYAAAGFFFGLPVVIKLSSLCWAWLLS